VRLDVPLSTLVDFALYQNADHFAYMSFEDYGREIQEYMDEQRGRRISGLGAEGRRVRSRIAPISSPALHRLYDVVILSS
jgi:hypothetical protein